MKDPEFYLPAILLVTAFACRFPGMRQTWRDPLLRTVNALLAVASSVFFFAAPTTIAAVNKITGVPNFSAPLVYSILTAFSASCLVLIINWRGGPPEAARRATLRCITAYSVVIVALFTLFALAHAPVERLRDLDTYYANTPYMREMIVLYLVAHTVAALVTTWLCWGWSVKVHGWLRAGLVLIVIGYLLNLVFDAVKYTAVAARWCGRDLDFLSTGAAPPVASMSAVLIGSGFIIPLVGPRFSDTWRSWSAYRKLGPLWRALHGAPASPGAAIKMAWWSPVELRLTQRESGILDGFLTLAPYFDRSLHSKARGAASRSGADPKQAEAVADAAMIAAALTARARDPEGRALESTGQDAAPSIERARDLIGVSQAYRRSAIVEAVRRNAARSENTYS
ncbi:MAB_1171c family putative transporter [Streptomyces sp. NBC_01431]|uniref:MAB_1171c family putative transporter n=1 Tax=Streptomyces sp. NBC_01431 TaxID=2903863 RepID=UPI002E2F3849|nr:MAB_1171c family putative transporter [Streptomyces sp. NBC_01431]